MKIPPFTIDVAVGVMSVMAGSGLVFGFGAGDDSPQAADQVVVAGNSHFALDLYDHLRQEKGNVFIAPHSISTAFAMTYAGARGETAQQMASTLHFTLPGDELHAAFDALQESLSGADDASAGPELHLANRLWGEKTMKFNEAFLDLVKHYYRGGYEAVDFWSGIEQSRLKINAWVEAQTRDRIKDLVQREDLPPGTPMVLVNAVYFKGNWKTRFDEEDTAVGTFFIDDETTATVPFMMLKERLPYNENDLLRIVDLPYEGERLSMVVLIPRARDGLEAMESSMSTEHVDAWLEGLEERTVQIKMPRFTMKDRFLLHKTLPRMGMPMAFSGRADFTGMHEPGGIFIGSVIHQTFIEVNEQGTEAAGATAVIMKRGGGDSAVVTLDHPFLFLIRDRETGTILFLGRCADPSVLAEA